MKNIRKINIAVVFITFNEEFHLGDAIENIRDIANEIFVLDSLSTDRTVDIALEKGAVVLQRPFTNFGDQWNFALNNFPIKSEWTMKMDPDERLSNELKKNILSFINDNSASGGAFFRRLWFMGKPLNVKQKILRIWKTGSCYFSNVIVNEHPIVKGKIAHIDGFLEHYDSRDLHQWLDKQNLYTSMEAIRIYKKQGYAVSPRLFGTKLERRMFLKRIGFINFPCRYLVCFFFYFFIQKAFLTGREGFYWAITRVWTFRMISMKVIEMKNNNLLIEIAKLNTGNINKKVLSTKLQQEIMKQTNYYVK